MLSCLAVESVAAGLGQDLDSAEADPIILGREGILVNANFTNR